MTGRSEAVGPRQVYRRDGFTLLETIFSTFVVALVMMAMFNVFPTSAVAIRRAEMRTFANNLAQHHLEVYRALPFEDVHLGPAVQQWDMLRDVRFSVGPEVFVVSGADQDLLKGVRVRVTWSDQGRSFSTQHETWIVRTED